MPGGGLERGDRIPMPQDTSRLAGIKEAVAFGAIDDPDVLHLLATIRPLKAAMEGSISSRRCAFKACRVPTSLTPMSRE